MTTMKAKFDGKCSVCGCRIALGQLQVYDRANKKVYCMAHNPEKQQAQKPTANAAAPKAVTTTSTAPTAAPSSVTVRQDLNNAAILAACDALIASAHALKMALGVKG